MLPGDLPRLQCEDPSSEPYCSTSFPLTPGKVQQMKRNSRWRAKSQCYIRVIIVFDVCIIIVVPIFLHTTKANARSHADKISEVRKKLKSKRCALRLLLLHHPNTRRHIRPPSLHPAYREKRCVVSTCKDMKMCMYANLRGGNSAT